jgi:hypothetical protein
VVSGEKGRHCNAVDVEEDEQCRAEAERFGSAQVSRAGERESAVVRNVYVEYTCGAILLRYYGLYSGVSHRDDHVQIGRRRLEGQAAQMHP